MNDSNPYEKLRSVLPANVRNAIMALRQHSLRNILTKEQAVSPSFVMSSVKNHGMIVGPFALIFTVETHEEGINWHLSISRRDRYPNWDELMIFRSVFFDDDMEVIQVLPPAEEYINMHANCFHLWHNTKKHIIL